jgi:hypothetical protein
VKAEEIVSKVCVAIASSKDDSNSGKKNEVETAQAIVTTSKDLEFTALKNKDVEVQDLLPNRSQDERVRIEKRLLELKSTDGISVKFMPANAPLNSFIPQSPDLPKPIRLEVSSPKQKNP